MKSVQRAEPYAGDLMRQCFIQPFDFKHAFAVVVTGALWNPCGHTLLNTGGGWYFYVVKAGGSKAGLYFNCPSRESFK